MSARTEQLFNTYVEHLKSSVDTTLLHEAHDERGAGLVVFECRCGALRCEGLQVAMLDHTGNAAVFVLTPELCTALGAALLKVGAS